MSFQTTQSFTHFSLALLFTQNLFRSHCLQIVPLRLQWETRKYCRLALRTLLFRSLSAVQGIGPGGGHFSSKCSSFPLELMMGWEKKDKAAIVLSHFPKWHFIRLWIPNRFPLFPDSPIFMSANEELDCPAKCWWVQCSACLEMNLEDLWFREVFVILKWRSRLKALNTVWWVNCQGSSLTAGFLLT